MLMNRAYSKTADVKEVLDGMATLALSAEKPRCGTKVWDSSSCGDASAYSASICQHDWTKGSVKIDTTHLIQPRYALPFEDGSPLGGACPLCRWQEWQRMRQQRKRGQPQMLRGALGWSC